MESTLALIWASISLSLFAKPQLLFTTKLWSRWPLTAGLMLEFCGLPLEKPVRITTHRNTAELGRENISVWWHSNIFKSVVLRRWSIGSHWLGIIAVRGKAEIKWFTETRTFSGLVNTRRRSNLVSGCYEPQNWEKDLVVNAFEQMSIWKSSNLKVCSIPITTAVIKNYFQINTDNSVSQFRRINKFYCQICQSNHS